MAGLAFRPSECMSYLNLFTVCIPSTVGIFISPGGLILIYKSFFSYAYRVLFFHLIEGHYPHIHLNILVQGQGVWLAADRDGWLTPGLTTITTRVSIV